MSDIISVSKQIEIIGDRTYRLVENDADLECIIEKLNKFTKD